MKAALRTQPNLELERDGDWVRVAHVRGPVGVSASRGLGRRTPEAAGRALERMRELASG